MTGGLAITAVIGVAWLGRHDGATASVPTKRQAELQTFPDHITSLRTSGFRASGDGGGARYRRSVDEPRHAGQFKSADGRWWELNETVVAPEMLGATGDGRNDDYPALVAALSVLRDGGVLRFTPGRTYRFLTGNGDALRANILADRITIDGYGARLVGLPASGILQDNPYNQYYRIFQANGRTGLRFRGINTVGALTMASIYACNDVAFEDCVDDGLIANPAGYLRDKTIYLYNCADTTIENCTFKNHNFAVYLSGAPDARTRRTTVRRSTFRHSVTPDAFKAPFPVGVYAHYADDTAVLECVFADIYSSTDDGSTGTGLGYGVYEGDGAANNVTVSDCRMTWRGNAAKNACGIYINEARSATIERNTLSASEGARVLYGILTDSKRNVCSRAVSGNTLVNIAGAKIGTAIAHNGSDPGNPEGHTLTEDNEVLGWETAISIFNLGRTSRHRIVGNKCRAQHAAQVALLGTPTNPICFAQILRNRIVDGGQQGVRLNGYVVAAEVHDNEILDGNQTGLEADAASAIFSSTYSFGLALSGNRIGNTPGRRGKYEWGVVNASNPHDRIFRDELGTNEFVGLAPASRFRRYLETEPSASFFDAGPDDFFLNTALGANGRSGWRATHVGKSKLTTHASSASRVVEVESTAGMASGQKVLLTRTALPHYGDYIDDWHADVIAGVIDGRRILLANGIPGPAGTFEQGRALLTYIGLRPSAD